MLQKSQTIENLLVSPSCQIQIVLTSRHLDISNSNLSTSCGTTQFPVLALTLKFTSLEVRREMGRVDYRKDFWEDF